MKIVSLITSLLSLTAAISMENPRDVLDEHADFKRVLRLEQPDFSDAEFDRLWTNYQGDAASILATLFSVKESTPEQHSVGQCSHEEEIRGQLKTIKQEQAHVKKNGATLTAKLRELRHKKIALEKELFGINNTFNHLRTKEINSIKAKLKEALVENDTITLVLDYNQKRLSKRNDALKQCYQELEKSKELLGGKQNEINPWENRIQQLIQVTYLGLEDKIKEHEALLISVQSQIATYREMLENYRDCNYISQEEAQAVAKLKVDRETITPLITTYHEEIKAIKAQIKTVKKQASALEDQKYQLHQRLQSKALATIDDVRQHVLTTFPDFENNPVLVEIFNINIKEMEGQSQTIAANIILDMQIKLEKLAEAKIESERQERVLQEQQTNIVDQAFIALSDGDFKAFRQNFEKIISFNWVRGDNNEAFLHIAAQNGQDDVIKLLLGRRRLGINVNWELANQLTALHLAVNSGHASTVKMLLDYRADVLAATDDGFTVLETALCYLEGRLEANDENGIARGMKIIDILKTCIQERVNAGNEDDTFEINYLYKYVQKYQSNMQKKSTGSIHQVTYIWLADMLEKLRIYLLKHQENVTSNYNY